MEENKIGVNTRQKYDERLKRVNDAVALREPDRVPCVPYIQTYPFIHAGYTMAEVLYDTEKAKDALRRYHREYEPDMANTYGTVFSGLGPVFERLGVNWLQWAGQPGATIDKNSVHQFIEKPYLEDDEYPELLSDYSGWVMKKWLPRSFSSLESLADVDFKSFVNFAFYTGSAPFANPAVLEMFQTIVEVGKVVGPWLGELGAFETELERMGFPIQIGPTTTTAFDSLSDLLRGTIDTMVDIIEQPENVLAATEMFYPPSLARALAQKPKKKGQWVFIPLHKGFDGFLSPEQYEEFYWPTLKRLVDGLIENDCVPYIYTEGKYDSRLECIADVPKGKCVFHFENVDMAEAKRIVGANSCICGGFNARILESGTRLEVEDAVKELLDICAPGGGYIFDLGDTMDDCKPENIEALFQTVKECGKY